MANETRIKICGLTNLEDAQLSAQLGADALGFNFCTASSRYINPASAKKIVACLPSDVLLVGVFVDTERETIKNILQTVGLNALQLHGSESPELCRGWEDLKIIRAIRLGAPGWQTALEKVQEEVDFVLFDSFVPAFAGGTGVAASADLLDHPAVRALLPRAFLAGGITPKNAAEKIRTYTPFGVDVASGVESVPGKKAAALLEALVYAVRPPTEV